MLFLRYLRAIPRLKGRPRVDPDFRLGIVTTIEVSVMQALATFWAIWAWREWRALDFPHDINTTMTLINVCFFFTIVTTIFLVAWGAILKMFMRELRPLVYLSGTTK